MPRTFLTWLLTLQDEETPIGELARDVATSLAEGDLSTGVTEAADLRAWLLAQAPLPVVLAAFDRAVERYELAEVAAKKRDAGAPGSDRSDT